ncbi:MAG: cyclopropane-fatty-acyl-phospholipid synthase family protein [Desulfuromonadales bacterium]|nr:cyclopropane-fatty-acyl-phospholipid synthase family protein [Desulfuromonadales bacterium]
MGDKLFYRELIKNLFSDPFEVKFWDGDIERFGEGEPKFRIIFNEPISKAKLLSDPSMAFGEGYMYKKVEIEGNLQQAIESIYNNSESFLRNDSKYATIIQKVSNSLKISKNNVQHHYDIGNDFYKLWLDETMTYSCAYFKTPDDTLKQAQINKVGHILKKLNLKKGETLLDIGCGWGELILTAAREYGVKATGITLSVEQYEKSRERIKSESLEDLVEVSLTDYREVKSRKFDRIVSVGMLEHVGKDHLREYFTKIRELLCDGGVSLLHSITSDGKSGPNSWINAYIFPGGYVPGINELVNYIMDSSFQLIDIEELRRHYGRTLEHWARNFENALPEIRKSKDETFIRMWRLYLNSCAASFNTGNNSVHQILFSKGINDSLPWTREYMN